jgi:hypothetical protein
MKFIGPDIPMILALGKVPSDHIVDGYASTESDSLIPVTDSPFGGTINIILNFEYLRSISAKYYKIFVNGVTQEYSWTHHKWNGSMFELKRISPLTDGFYEVPLAGDIWVEPGLGYHLPTGLLPNNVIATIELRIYDEFKNDITGSPILNTIGVMIENVPPFPEISSIMSRTSFIDQIRRAIDAKCKSGQRKAGQPSILILDTWDWHFNYFEFESFVEIRKFILKELRKCPSISGLILFHNIIIAGESYGFHDGRYIENDACSPNIRVRAKDLECLSLIKSHNDPKIRSEKNINLDNSYDTQLKKIKEIIEIQPTISLQEDKINLLSDIEVFLLNSRIEEKIVKDINEIVTEYCFDTDPTGTDAEVSSDPEDASISSSPPTVRSRATSCIFKLLKHSGTPENIELAMSMTRDNNTLVREEAAKNLAFLHQLDSAKSINAARKLVNDNERVRRRIACIF